MSLGMAKSIDTDSTGPYDELQTILFLIVDNVNGQSIAPSCPDSRAHGGSILIKYDLLHRYVLDAYYQKHHQYDKQQHICEAMRFHPIVHKKWKQIREIP